MATKKKAPAIKKTAPAKAAPKKKILAKAPAASKQADLQQQIAALQAQVEEAKQEAVAEVKEKLSAARQAVKNLENQLSSLTGKAPETKASRTRRPSISDNDLQPQILAAMSKHGKAGLNAKQLSELVGQDAFRVRKFITANGKVLKRVGTGPGTKFHLP